MSGVSKSQFLESVRLMIRVKHLSLRAEEAFLLPIRRHHLSPGAIRRAFKIATAQASIAKSQPARFTSFVRQAFAGKSLRHRRGSEIALS